jgi:hypothetical protein
MLGPYTRLAAELARVPESSVAFIESWGWLRRLDMGADGEAPAAFELLWTAGTESILTRLSA